jgi:tRNA G26 N,N-dimethylase Trm1
LVETIRSLPHGTSGHSAYAVDVKCTVTGKVFGPVFTSDLFQVSTCPEVRKETKSEAKKAQKAELKEAMAYLASKKAQ